MKKVLLIGIPVVVLVAGIPLGLKKLQTDAHDRRVRELGALLETEIRAHEALDRTHAPLFMPEEEGTAWEYYRRAAVLSDEIVAGLPDPLSPAGSTGLPDWPGPPHPLPEEWAADVEKFAPVHEPIRQGTSTRDRGMPWDLRRGRLTREPREGDFSEFPPYEFIGRAALSISRDEVSEGVDLILIGDRMAEDLLRDGETYWDGFWTRIAAAETLSAYIGAGRFPADQVDRGETWARSRLVRPPSTWSFVEGDLLRIQADLLRIARGHALIEGSVNPEWYERLTEERIEPGPFEALDALEELREEIPALRRAHDSGEPAFLAAMKAMEPKFTGRSPAHDLVLSEGWGFTMVSPLLDQTLGEARDMLLMNAALFRHRKLEGRDPPTIAEIVPEGVRKKTSRGPWSWRSDPAVPHHWIERGLLADIRAKEAESFKAMGKLLEGMGVIEEGTITEEDE